MIQLAGAGVGSKPSSLSFRVQGSIALRTPELFLTVKGHEASYKSRSHLDVSPTSAMSWQGTVRQGTYLLKPQFPQP